MDYEYYVYLLTNKHHNVLYVGVTNHLIRRTYEHKDKVQKSFTCKYNVNRLIYYEVYNDIFSAIAREKQIKKWNRRKKEALINQFNPLWLDLYDNFF
ncbi:MAG: GIY-YIG nuclease family protein [Gammaproteobacteria bacterium]